MVGSELVVIDTKNLEGARKDTEQMLASIVLAKSLEGYAEKPQSAFERRLEELKKQKGL
jgi:hypothetical protein